MKCSPTTSDETTVLNLSGGVEAFAKVANIRCSSSMEETRWRSMSSQPSYVRCKHVTYSESMGWKLSHLRHIEVAGFPFSEQCIKSTFHEFEFWILLEAKRHGLWWTDSYGICYSGTHNTRKLWIPINSRVKKTRPFRNILLVTLSSGIKVLHGVNQ